MIRKTALLAAWLAIALPAHAIDGAALELGRGDDSAELVRGALQWKWQRTWFGDRSWHVAGYWEASVGAWYAETDVADFGFTPVFRLQKRDGPGPYFEAAIGFHLLSEGEIGPERIFGTRFQFGDHLAAGWRFGERGRWDLSLRVQHLSNGGIKEPNPGINFAIVRLAMHFQ